MIEKIPLPGETHVDSVLPAPVEVPRCRLLNIIEPVHSGTTVVRVVTLTKDKTFY